MAIKLTLYFEDMISEIGLWHSFCTEASATVRQATLLLSCRKELYPWWTTYRGHSVPPLGFHARRWIFRHLGQSRKRSTGSCRTYCLCLLHGTLWGHPNQRRPIWLLPRSPLHRQLIRCASGTQMVLLRLLPHLKPLSGINLRWSPRLSDGLVSRQPSDSPVSSRSLHGLPLSGRSAYPEAGGVACRPPHCPWTADKAANVATIEAKELEPYVLEHYDRQTVTLRNVDDELMTVRRTEYFHVQTTFSNHPTQKVA